MQKVIQSALLRNFVILVVSFSISFVTVRTVNANDLGIRWYQSSAFVRDFGTMYNTATQFAVNDYRITDMKLNWTTSGSGPGYIHITQADYGANGQPAWAQIFRNGIACSNPPPHLDLTGQCNATTLKANTGYVYINSFSGYQNWHVDYPGAIIRHEIGHNLGMAHPSGFPQPVCNVATVMKVLDCRTNLFQTLQQLDKDRMNNRY
jgi:hypothetical protein